MSNDAIQPVDEISPASKEMDEWVVEIGARLEKPDISHATRPSMDSNSSNSEEWPSIFGNWQCWDDFGASFIPETLKWDFVACMTHLFDLNVRSYLEYMQEKVDLAWSYYHVVHEQFRAENSKRFIEHLLVNSCFLIFVMVLSLREKDPGTKDPWRKDLKDKLHKILDKSNLPKGLTPKDFKNIVNFILDDPGMAQCYMLTMVYQIPWFVLEAVYTKLSNIGKILDTPIHKIALSCFPTYPRFHTSKVDCGTIPKGGFKHLLHIFHWSRTPDRKYLVDTLRPTKWIGRFHIPSATDLQLSQTVFVKDEGASIDVSYYNGILSGVMQLAPWHLFDYSNKLYESLLIFERQYGGLCGHPFTAYVACMACLLKTEADVRVLRANGVIPSTRFDDKDILCCVQKLKTLFIGNLKMPNELIILEEKVMAHYQRSAYRVYGEFKSRYCANPWITISVIAGICLFVLTFIQTVVSILSLKKQ